MVQVSKPRIGISLASHVQAPKPQKMVKDLVLSAVADLKEKDGSEIKDIKKCLGNKYGLDVIANEAEIKRCLGSAVHSGALLNTEGKYKMAARRRRRSSGRRRRRSGGKRRSRSRRRTGSRRRRRTKRKSSGRRRRRRARKSAGMDEE